MKQFDTVVLKQEELEARGINLNAMGITSRKNRPYVIIAQNRQMTWLAPLTTVLKHGHGRVQVGHVHFKRYVDCEVVTTDMFSISTNVLNAVGKWSGKLTVSSRPALIKQLQFTIACGSLGRPVT